MPLPNDPIILLSFINTKLRDYYFDLDDLCLSLHIEKDNLIEKLGTINYCYDISRNQFI